MLGAGEDQSAVDRFAPQNVSEDRWLRSAIDRRMRCSTRSTVEATGVTATWPDCAASGRELGDGARHRGGEQQRLPFRGKLGDDLADVVDKAHVEHPVGFIEHEKFDLAETQRVARHEIEQASGRGDEHVDAVLQRANLRAHRHTADHQRGTGADVAAVSAEAVEYLAGQLACRGQHQHTAGLALRRAVDL